MSRLTFGVLIVFSAILVPVGQADSNTDPAAIVEGFSIPFEKFVLSNGLTLIVHEDHKAPIVAVNVWYHVGSKNEMRGKTGFAHLFEHLMFNGTENFNDDYFQPLEKVGATDMNGTTNSDRTNYFQNVPASALDVALWMESDRMGHLLGAIDQAKLDEQRGVVQNEKRQGENQPYGVAEQLLTENTYPVGHPYSWTTIGSMEDLNAASLDDVGAWFKTYYGAANAVLSVAGDVDTQDVKQRVEKYFGDIPSGPPIAKHDAWVARREGEQRQTVHDRVPQARIYKVWNVPQWGTPEMAHLDLLSDLLSDGKNSRLYKRLVYDAQICTDVAAYVFAQEIAGQFMIVATAKAGADLGEVERAVDEELAAVMAKGPAKKELDRIKTQHFARFVRGAERIGGFGGKSDILAMNEVYGGSPDAYQTQLDRVRDATSDDLRDVAKAWLNDGVYVLEVLRFPAYSAAAEGAGRSVGPPQAGDPPAAKFPEVQRATLSNGLQLVLAERHDAPLVTMDLMINAGFAADSLGTPGLAGLALDLLDEGTTKRSSLDISAELAALGAVLSTSASLDTCTLGLSALKTNLSESIDIFADVLLNPAFDAQEFSRLQKQAVAGIQQERSTPAGAGLRVLPALLFGAGHAYGNPLSGSGTEASVQALTPADLKKFHETWFRPNNATLIVVGDTTLAEMSALLETALGGWTRGDVPVMNAGKVALAQSTRVFLIDRPGAQQSYIFAALVAPPPAEVNEEAVDTMNRVFGGTFTSRINMNLREDKHWSYGARSSLYDGRIQRAFVATAPVQTDKTKESLVELSKELDEIVGARPITEEESAKSIQSQVLRLPGLWETSGAVKSSLREMVAYGLPDDYFDSYADRIRGLARADVTKAANEVIHPASVTWLVVGDLALVEQGVRDLGLGPVTVIADESAVLK